MLPLDRTHREATARNGVVVAHGYAVSIRVERGFLCVEDGVGLDRQYRRFHRATGRVKRLVVLGASGAVTLAALRWLSDVGAAFVQIDRDSRVLAAFGPPGTDRPSLRRAQALASQNGTGLALSRWLVDAKLAAQMATLRRFANHTAADEALAVIESYRSAIGEAQSFEELRASEAWAAGAYWQALAPLEVRFARRDEGQVATHWRTFGGRSSPLANGPRLAANPVNAVLNYLYALLEAEASLAARTVGLDPGLGVMHVDQAYRDSLACDLMEPVRPQVDAYAFEYLTSRPCAARDFFETRAGACRVTPPLAHELAATIPQWRDLVGRVAEDFAAALESPAKRRARTPISGRRRSEGRPTGPRVMAKSMPRMARGCLWCGSPTTSGRRTCSAACAEQVIAQTHDRFVEASSERMTRLARQPGHPARTAEANRRRSETLRQLRAAELAWEQQHPEPSDPEWFIREVAPKLAGMSARAIARATGLSVSYCADIRRGVRVPHPRWWNDLLDSATRRELSDAPSRG